MKFIIVFALLFISNIAVGQVLIGAPPLLDTFGVDSMIVGNATSPTGSVTINSDTVIGGERTLSVQFESSDTLQLATRCSVVEQRFALSNDITATGSCDVLYTGPGGSDISPPVNLIENGCDCWLVRVLQKDNDLRINITAISRLTRVPLASSVVLRTDISEPVDVCIPYDNSNFQEYSQVLSIEVLLESLEANVDAVINYTCCAPRVSCWHSIDFLNNIEDQLFPGDQIRLSITCNNFETLPADTERVSVVFPIDQDHGEIDPGSVSCTSLATNIASSFTEMSFDAELDDTEQVSCSFIVDLIAPGIIDDIQASITDSDNTFVNYNSHAEIDRSGTEEFCLSAEASEIVIQLTPTTMTPTTEGPPTVPTTLPPTTDAPTTEPPTTTPPTTVAPTEPPTTAGPTTLPPTTLPPTTRPPTTVAPGTLPTTLPPTTLPPTTGSPTTLPPTNPPTTRPPTTQPPTTLPPTTNPPTTLPPATNPTTLPPTNPPTTRPPTTQPPTTLPPTTNPPTTLPPATNPTTLPPTNPPTTRPPTTQPPTTLPPTTNPPTTLPPATNPTTLPPTNPPTTRPPTTQPPTTLPPTTNSPTTLPPATNPTTLPPTNPPTTRPPTTQPPTTLPPTTNPPTTLPPATNPTTLPPTTLPPTTGSPTTLPPTNPPTTRPPTTLPPTTLPPTTRSPTTLPPTNPPTTLPPATNPPTTRAPTTNPPTAVPTTIAPPTTVAPTAPPTTAPPTTFPPTLPPIAICVSPYIYNGTCFCNTFPCFDVPGTNDIQCETSEWYCWFITRVPDSGSITVSYRGEECICEVP